MRKLPWTRKLNFLFTYLYTANIADWKCQSMPNIEIFYVDYP